MAAVKFSWWEQIKRSGSFMIGTSPEFDLAVFTLCFLSRRSRRTCDVSRANPILSYKNLFLILIGTKYWKKLRWFYAIFIYINGRTNISKKELILLWPSVLKSTKSFLDVGKKTNCYCQFYKNNYEYHEFHRFLWKFIKYLIEYFIIILSIWGFPLIY